jgi:hypothetical protein
MDAKTHIKLRQERHHLALAEDVAPDGAQELFLPFFYKYFAPTALDPFGQRRCTFFVYRRGNWKRSWFFVGKCGFVGEFKDFGGVEVERTSCGGRGLFFDRMGRIHRMTAANNVVTLCKDEYGMVKL